MPSAQTTRSRWLLLTPPYLAALAPPVTGIVSARSEARSPASRGTFYWGGAFATSYWVDPAERMVFILYRQVQPTTKGEILDRFRNLVYQAIETPVASPARFVR